MAYSPRTIFPEMGADDVMPGEVKRIVIEAVTPSPGADSSPLSASSVTR